MPRLIWKAILAVVICSWTQMAMAEPRAAGDRTRVAILCSPYRSYREAASALQEALEQGGCECVLIELPKAGDEPARKEALKRLAEAKPVVIATSGANATSIVLEAVPNTPVVFFMVHNALDAAFMANGNPNRARVAGVAADVSPKDWIDWIVRLDPYGKRIGVLRSPRTRRTVEALEQAARHRGVILSVVDVEENGFLKAIDALNNKDPSSILMTLDPKVYNAATVEHLLVWGIREKKPVWAFSASIVKAGAFAGLYPQAKAVGRQAAELVQKVIEGTAPNKLGVQYPRQVTKAVNDRTAEMIGVTLSSKATDERTVRFGAKP